MHRKNFLSTILASLILILPCHASGISKWWAEITSPKLSIDFSLRISEGHPAASEENYFRWKDSSGDSAKDSLDAISGASKSASTKRFDSIMYTNPGDKNNLFPQSLRNLFLYAVTSQDFMDKDDFLIESDQGKIKIQFRHRGSAYKIVTDEKGLLNFTQATEEKNAPENQDAPTSDSPEETDGTPKDAKSNDVTPNSAATEMNPLPMQPNQKMPQMKSPHLRMKTHPRKDIFSLQNQSRNRERPWSSIFWTPTNPPKKTEK